MNLKQRIFRWYTELVTPRRSDVSFKPPTSPLSQLKVALVTTAGTRLPDQKPFDTDLGDPSFREIQAFGPTGDEETHRRVVRQCLGLLSQASGPTMLQYHV
jgi:hypothetical protein